MAEAIELRPCPFCASEMESTDGVFGHVGGSSNCPIYYSAFDDAEAGAWNARAEQRPEIGEAT